MGVGGEVGVLVEFGDVFFYCLYFFSKRGNKVLDECMLVLVGSCGMFEDRKKGSNRSLEE